MTELRRVGLSSQARQIDSQRTRRSSQTSELQYGAGQAVDGASQVVDIAANSFLGTNAAGALYGRVEEPLYVDRGVLKVREEEEEEAGPTLLKLVEVTDDYAVTDEDVVFVKTAGKIITLPSATGNAGRRVYIKRMVLAGADIEAEPYSGDTIDLSAANLLLPSGPPLNAATLVSNGKGEWGVV